MLPPAGVAAAIAAVCADGDEAEPQKVRLRPASVAAKLSHCHHYYISIVALTGAAAAGPDVARWRQHALRSGERWEGQNLCLAVAFTVLAVYA